VRTQAAFEEPAPSAVQPDFTLPEEPPAKTPKAAAAPRSGAANRGDLFAPEQANPPMAPTPSITPNPLDLQRDTTERCPPGHPCTDAFGDCRTLAETVKGHTIDKISLEIRLKGTQGEDYPCDCPVPNVAFIPRDWGCTTYTWKASGACHKPLYFEEPELERYGHNFGCCLQPVVSGAHFLANIALLPYNMGLETPCECVYPVGYYRPGDCAPRMCPAVPLSLRAGLFEAGGVTGACFIVP
jgi:hypothetical protein